MNPVKFCLFFIFTLTFNEFTTATNCISQQKLDSLLQITSNKNYSDSIISKAYNEIGVLYFDCYQYENAIPYLQLSSDFSKKEKNYCNTIEIASNIALCYYRIGEIDSAKQQLSAAFELEKESNCESSFAFGYNIMGILNVHLGHTSSALQYYQKSIDLAEIVHDTVILASVLNNFGEVYFRQEDFKNAAKMFKSSLELRSSSKDYEELADGYWNLGSVYLKLKDLPSFSKSMNKAATYYLKIGGDYGIGSAFYVQGTVLQQYGKYDSSNTAFYQVIEPYKRIGIIDYVQRTYNHLANNYNHLNQLDSVEKYAIKSLEIATKIGTISGAHNSLRKLYQLTKKEGRWKESLTYHEQLIEFRDSIKNEASQKAMIRQQSKFEYEKQKAIDDAENDKLIAIEKKENEKQTILTYSVILVLLLVVIFLATVFNRLIIIKKQNKIIVKQKNEVEFQKSIVDEAHQEISDSIKYAENLQKAILPSKKDLKFELKKGFVLFQPKHVVSGDFYWMEKTFPNQLNGSSQLLIAAADCTGHGVPGAMVSVVCSNALNRSVNEFKLTQPALILGKTRELVINTFSKSGTDIKDGMDIALCALHKENETSSSFNKVSYSGANNPLWIVRKSTLVSKEKKLEKSTVQIDDYTLIEFKADRKPVGLYDNMGDFFQHEIELYKNDILYLFTDGYADQFGGKKGKKLMYKPFKKLLLSLAETPIEAQQQIILSKFQDWKGSLEQIDDVCIIGIQI